MTEFISRESIYTILYLACFLYGACIFSFLNVLIYRVPRKIPFWKGRSMCTSCGHTLNGFDMIPVFGWFLLGGRCRYCKERISFRYAAVELLGGILGCVCFRLHGFSWGMVVLFSFFAVLTIVALTDWDTMEIPNGFVTAAGVVAVCSLAAGMEPGLMERGIGAVCISLPMLLLTMVIPGAFGGGDIKLMIPCGFFLGWKLTLFAMFVAVLVGGGYGICLLVTGKKGRKEHFAFGPFLCLGMAVAVFWGTDLIAWYLGILGL